MPETDWDLLDRARRGSETAWRTLSDKHRPRLLALAWSITCSRMAAEDMAQESFARLLTRPPRPQGDSLLPWLATIAYRLAVKESRRSRKVATCESLDLEDETPRPGEVLLAQDRRKSVAQALQALSEEHRAVITLHFQGGLTYEQIAALLRTPLGTVKSRLFHAVKNCRSWLRNREN